MRIAQSRLVPRALRDGMNSSAVDPRLSDILMGKHIPFTLSTPAILTFINPTPFDILQHGKKSIPPDLIIDFLTRVWAYAKDRAHGNRRRSQCGGRSLAHIVLTPRTLLHLKPSQNSIVCDAGGAKVHLNAYKMLQPLEEQLAWIDQPIHALLLVGGFAGSEYLKQRVEQQFCKRIAFITSPPDADTATLCGAAQYELVKRSLGSAVICPRSSIIKLVDELWVPDRLERLVSKGKIIKKGQ
ncbi:hypothetical protein H1R20_g15430, partial [Candolleomyces eurysporus]